MVSFGPMLTGENVQLVQNSSLVGMEYGRVLEQKQRRFGVFRWSKLTEESKGGEEKEKR